MAGAPLPEVDPRIASRLADWEEAGLLPVNTADAIRAWEREHHPAEPEDHGFHFPRRINLTVIATYFGAFLILFALTIFSAVQWVDMSNGIRLVYSGLITLILFGIGVALRRRPPILAGELLMFVATAIAPIPIWCLLRATGIWPSYPEIYPPVYHSDLVQAWIILDLAIIGITAAVLLWSRFPLLVIPLVLWSWLFALDAARLLDEEPERFSVSDPTQVARIMVGLLAIAAGIFLDRRTRRDYSFWLYLCGHVALLIPFATLAIRYKATIGLVAFPLFYLTMIVLAVILQRNVFVIFGAVGVYGWLTYMAFDTFPGQTGFSLSLAIIGLIIVLSARWFQKSGRAWMERILGVRRGHHGARPG